MALGARGRISMRVSHSVGTYKPFLPFPDAAQIGQGIEPQPLAEENLPVHVEAEEMLDPEVIVDMESQEDASDCFPDPTDD